MTDKEKQVLNEKIAKWCGFKHLITRHLWLDPNKVHTWGELTLPNFCGSMEELVKWAVPKLFQNNLDLKLYSDDGYFFCQITRSFTDKMIADSVVGVDSPSLALVLCIEKLIDNKPK